VAVAVAIEVAAAEDAAAEDAAGVAADDADKGIVNEGN
jgi:hypothetical protein